MGIPLHIMMNSAAAYPIPDPVRGGLAPWPSSFSPMHEVKATAFQFQCCEVVFVTGVNVMRISLQTKLRSAGLSIDAMDRLFRPESVKASMAAAAIAEPVIELSTLQTIALLKMNRSTLCRGIATHLASDAQDMPSLFDYRALTAHGLCYRPEGEKWHSITPKGAALAAKIARAKARELGIHLMIEGGNEGATASYSCTCGKWSGAYQRGQFTQSNALRNWSRHVAQASPTAKAESA